jgi:hypothetical protein
MRRHARGTGVESGLLVGPDVTLVAVAIELFGRLPLLRIGIDAGVDWRRRRRMGRLRRWRGGTCAERAEQHPDDGETSRTAKVVKRVTGSIHRALSLAIAVPAHDTERGTCPAVDLSNA